MLEWRATAAADREILPLGEATADAAAAVDAVATKVDDYFARCRLAAFDGQASEALTDDEWQALCARLAAWRTWMAARPETAAHTLDSGCLEQVTGDDTRVRLEALIQADLDAEASAAIVDDLERLVRYQRDLVTLLRNFVTISDF